MTGKILLSLAAGAALILTAGCVTYDRPYTAAQLTGVRQQKAAPVRAAKPAASAARPRISRAAGDYYTVKRGDTLYSVAFVYDMDYRTLALINGIKPPYAINAGARLLTNPAKSGMKLYRVAKGDTVYSISKRFGLTPAQLAAKNGIDSSYAINAGQMLSVGGGTAAAAPRQTQTAARASAAKPAKPAAKAAGAAPAMTAREPAAAKAPAAARTAGRISWRWPCGGAIVEGYSSANRGIDIAGKRGDAVMSAAQGRIVYAGDALRGYGNLIIVNHNDEYLSAYAHNDAILVAEGQTVKSGQVIAKMGDSDAKSVRLHFEIRHNGESVNPLSYLPKR